MKLKFVFVLTLTFQACLTGCIPGIIRPLWATPVAKRIVGDPLFSIIVFISSFKIYSIGAQANK